MTAETQHDLLLPLDLDDPMDGLDDVAAANACGSSRLVHAPCPPPTLGSASVQSESDDSIAKGLLDGEMMSDYLEAAAADDIDREHIRKNEFAWLLSNKISDLEASGLIPPRFADVVTGLVACKVLLPANEKGKEKEKGKGTPGRKRLADGIVKPAPSARVTAEHELVDPASEGSQWGSAAPAEMTGADAVDEDVYYSVLGPRMGSGFGESGAERCELVWRWLRRKLYDEIDEQAFAVSRGLREVIPPGLLALFSAPELQALLGDGAQVSDAELEDWKANTEYVNGLHADHVRVRWFWETVAAMDKGECTHVIVLPGV